jgi:predicted kinase
MTTKIANKPTLIIVCGLIGTGKTTLANALAERLGCAAISSDAVRKKLAGILETEHRYEEFDKGIYSPVFTTQTYYDMFTSAGDILRRGNSVILDASFSLKDERIVAKAFAEDYSADFLAVECRLDENIVKERLANRQDTVSDGRWEIYQKQKEVFEPITELPPDEHLVVDTAKPVSEIVEAVLAEINGGDQ